MKGTDSYSITIELLPKPSSSKELAYNSQDYRFSSVTITGFDLADMSHDPLATIEPLKAQSIGEGIIHLFRDFESSYNENEALAEDFPADDTMVSIIAVPTYFTATDILGFIGDHYMDYLTHIRILKSEKPNRFLVLLKFSDAVKAAEFQYYYDGKPFNSMEPEACHVIFVRSIVFEGTGSSEVSENLLPFIMRDPFTGAIAEKEVAQSESDRTQIELPTCPVCLERLDHEISGLLTIPCQHTFHCQCLSRWKDDTCPVCRYTNNIPNNNIRQSVRRLSQINSRIQHQQTQQNAPDDSQQQSLRRSGVETCMACNVCDNLWVCLICGNLGCSRYAPEQHSLKHFIETGHCFAMELSSSRVWDYAGDNYVHRLIASESDGKIVEFPEKDNDSKIGASKSESQQIESSELLLSQLLSQREYYELLLKEKTGTERTKRTSSVAESLNYSRKISDLETKLSDVTGDLDKLKLNVIPALKQKISMKEVSLKVASQELSESNALNDGLSEKVTYLTAQNKELKAQVEDLGEQVKDLMFYLESQAKFKDQPDDVKEGQIVIKPPPKSSKPKKKKK